ncbi:uncharacterized protein TNCV_3949691 [Trichonephila clavipes]|nr:uncharacterized protein TNCV_3949691 [Trichonephila clavipes]
MTTQQRLRKSLLAHNSPIVLSPGFFTNRQVSDTCSDGQAPSALCRLLPPLMTIRHCVCKATVSCLESDLVHSATRGLLETDHVISCHGQVTWTTPELSPPLLTTTPHQREDISTLDRFNVHRCPTRPNGAEVDILKSTDGTGLEPVTKQATVRYLYHFATAATKTRRCPPLWQMPWARAQLAHALRRPHYIPLSLDRFNAHRPLPYGGFLEPSGSDEKRMRRISS